MTRAALLAAASYMVDLVAQVWQPLRPLSRYSHFHHYNTLNLITGSGHASSEITVLACVTGAALALACLIFQYRDL